MIRITLLAAFAHPGITASETIRAILLGLIFDLVIAAFFIIPAALVAVVTPHRFYYRSVGQWLRHLVCFATVCAVFFIGVAEFFFWEEFGVRFNFIAVDYLVYTTEVLGNIRESYPLHLILPAIAAAALVGTILLHRALSGSPTPSAPLRFPRRAPALALVLFLPVSGALILRNDWAERAGANIYAQELAKNGVFSFVAAFRNNSLRYDAFYATLPLDEAFARVRSRIKTSDATFTNADPRDLRRHIVRAGPERKWNIIQITVESLSAEFLGSFGNPNRLTPNLDELARDSLLFTRLYATGNRTDRGMEALTLSVPPTPGRSIIKRPRNENMFTAGTVFRGHGYECSFLYGGFGYFDNMNYFFGSNGYKVVDRATAAAGDITFANAWGACDEDLFRWSLREADASFARGQPFFQFVMTTSNHRPFTYPEGRIDIPSHSGREGAVKYTDYAIGSFIREAKTKPWFNNTLFVIVADHCASSAGRTELPVEKYSIPMLIYNPGLVTPRRVDELCSQIDYAPTLFGILNWTYTSEFYGRDILRLSPPEGRALIANYQKLGLMDQKHLAILKPKRETAAFSLAPSDDRPRPDPFGQELIEEAISYYETAGYLFAHRGLTP